MRCSRPRPRPASWRWRRPRSRSSSCAGVSWPSFDRGGSDGNRFDQPARGRAHVRCHPGAGRRRPGPEARRDRTARPQRRRQDHAAAPAGDRAAAHPGKGARAGPGPGSPGRAHRHPPPARLPAARGRLPARLHRLRLRGLHRAAQGVDPAGGAARGSAPRARPGGAVRSRRQADPGHVRRPAPAGLARPGAARLATGADPGRADDRGRPGAAGGPADRARGDRAHVGRGAVHPPDRGRRGPVRARDRAGPRPGPLRRAGHRPDRPGGGPGLAGRRAGPGGERLLADRHRPVPQRRRPRAGRRRARRAVPRRRVPAAARRVTADRGRRGGGVVTSTLAFGPPATSPGRATFPALAIRETRRLVLNPVFLAAVAFIAFALWAGPDAGQTEIDTSNPYAAISLGGFGMMATYWLTRSMRASEPVVGVTPVTQPARTAALCAVALVPFACGCLALLRFVQLTPVSSPLYGPFSPSARVAVLAGQIVILAICTLSLLAGPT